jgi:hypothetical protein
MTTISSDESTHPIRVPRATPVRRQDDALVCMISAIRDYATRRLAPEVAYLCDVALGGNARAIAEVKRAIDAIDPASVFPPTDAIPEPVGTWGEEFQPERAGAWRAGVAPSPPGIGIGSR